MSLYLGETVTIVAETLGRDGRPLRPPPTSAAVELWAPGRLRSAPPTIAAAAMTYFATTSEWAVDLDTSGGAPWIAGTWTYRVTARAAYTNFDYFTFDLEAP